MTSRCKGRWTPPLLGPGIHEIRLTASPVFTDARVHIGPVNPAWIWALVIRPAPGKGRATIASLNGNQTIFSIGPNGARDVYFVDLDIIRHSLITGT